MFKPSFPGASAAAYNDASPCRRRAWCAAWLLLAVAGVLIAPFRAHATSVKVYCIGDSFQLADVLSTGNESASVNLDIRLQQGTYAIGTTSYDFIAPTTIRGGYTDGSCTARNANPYNTIVDLSGGSLTLRQPKSSSRAKLTIDGITIRNGSTVDLIAGTINDLSNDEGDLTVVRTRFTNLAGADSRDTIFFQVATGNGFIENVLFDHIATQGFPACALFLYVDGSEANFGLNYVTADFPGSVCLGTGPTYYVTNYFDIVNSIFWHSGPGLPVISTLWNNQSSTLYLDFQSSIAHAAYDKDGNLFSFYQQIDADPKWVSPASGSYDLGPGSPAIDTAFAQTALGLPSNDMIGQARDLGPAPDLGALESNGSTVPTYIVSNTDDSGAGSLRQAITDANTNADQAEIIFQLPGACPQVIALSSTLPDITSPVRIDGYSQAGAAPNLDADAFLPTLCVLLKPAAGTLGYALRVPVSAANGALDVSGIGFGGFTQPIVLLGGTTHRIAGNQFGGNDAGTALPGAGLNAISVGMGSSGSVMIGGPSAGERNMISGAANGSGVNIQSSVIMDTSRCQIVNNIIGANQDFSAAVPNGWGINLAGSGCLVQGNRIVGNQYDGVWINGGVANYVQRNIIGVGANDGPLNFANGWGVRVTGNYNVIGSTAQSSAQSGALNANTIAYMIKGGVEVDNPYSNPVGDSVRVNLIYANGIDGNALAIDLGADGPTANDATDADSGPNRLQNFPKITALKYASGFPAPGAQNVSAYFFGELDGTTPGLYRMDAYFYNGSCQPGQRGQAMAYLGSYPATIVSGANKSVFNYTLVLPNNDADAAVAFTATDQDGNTSEMSPCFAVSKAAPLDDIFKDGLGD